MGFRKYQSVEKVEVPGSKDQKKIAAVVSHYGKTSAQELSEEERKALDAKRVN